MSHVVTYQAKFVDLNCLKRCCNRNGYTFKTDKQSLDSMFGPNENCVAAIELKDWVYPIYVDQNGDIHYDNYNGNWGSNESLDKLKQDYAREACYMQAESQGYTVQNEHYTADGKLVMELVQY